MARIRYWTASCTYDGKQPFRFWTSAMVVEAEFETVAHDALQAIVRREWAKISPHPAPRLLEVVPGRLVMEAD